MFRCAAVLVVCGILLLPSSSPAQDSTVDIPAGALNHLVNRLGSPSNAGIYVPPEAEPPSNALAWQWWVTDAQFSLSPGAMRFTATVRSQIGDQTSSETRTVPATILFDPSSGRLRISIAAFVVPLRVGEVTVTNVDVAKLYSLGVPIEPQTFVLSLPGGETRTLTGRVTGLTTQVEAGRLVLNVDVDF